MPKRPGAQGEGGGAQEAKARGGLAASRRPQRRRRVSGSLDLRGGGLSVGGGGWELGVGSGWGLGREMSETLEEGTRVSGFASLRVRISNFEIR